jgi:ABC-type lipoprotein export system ATPase subunit
MLSFDSVTKEFRLDEATTITPVRNVTLDIKRGEFVIVIGRSGTGKTTLLNLAAGLVRPNSGRVAIDGTDLSGMTQKQLSALRSEKMGFLFQFPSLIPALTVMDNVTLPSIFARRNGNGNGNHIEKRACELLCMLGLESKAAVHPKQLSAGETKRVVLARSLINQPQLVLADEPTSDLDERTEKEVMSLLRDVNSRGVTFVIVTHSLQLVPFATRAFEMQDGSLNAIKTLKDIGARLK